MEPKSIYPKPIYPKPPYVELPHDIMPFEHRPPSPKRRKPNFSDRELMLLMKAVIARKEVVFGKMSGEITRETKLRAWVDVANEVNMVNGFRRTPGDFRRKLKDYRSALKKKLTEARQMNNAEGESILANLTPAEEALATIIDDSSFNVQSEAPEEEEEPEESNTNDAQSLQECVESVMAFPLEFEDTPPQTEEREVVQDNKSACSSSTFSDSHRKKTNSKRRKSEDYTQNPLDIDTKTTRRKEDHKQNLQNTEQQNAYYNQTLLDIERQKLHYLNNKLTHNHEKQEDEDLMFFKTLLKHVKKIPDHKKMSFRNRIQDAVEEFAYPAPTTSSTQPAASPPVAATPRTINISSSTPPQDMHNYAADLITITHGKIRNGT